MKYPKEKKEVGKTNDNPKLFPEFINANYFVHEPLIRLKDSRGTSCSALNEM